MGRETDSRHLLVKSQCLAQFGRRSAACTLMFPQQSLETKRCENIRERDGTNWYRRWTMMDEIFKPLLSGTTPSPPKFNVIVTWSALAPMDEKNQTPNITFANTRAETLRFGGAGVQHSACCRVWIFCPSTVSFSDVFTSFGLQTLLWKHQCACCWSSSKLRKTLAFHK